MARRTKQEAELTRESVLQAALDLFSEKGYSRTTFSEIATRIGMTRGAVYWHFANKEALLTALIESTNAYKEEWVAAQIPDIRTLADVRTAFVMYARAVAEDERVRKFQFFMQFQMEWSQGLLNETHRKLNDIRQSPLEEFRQYFEAPEIAPLLKESTDLNELVVTLAAFWMGACSIFLGGCPFVELAFTSGEASGEPWRPDFVQAIGQGFDLIMSGALKGTGHE